MLIYADQYLTSGCYDVNTSLFWFYFDVTITNFELK